MSTGEITARDWLRVDRIKREHDYRQGRTAAHERLPGILGLEEPYPREGGAARPNPQYDPDPNWRKDLPEAEISWAPRKKKVRFRNVVMDQLDGVLKDGLGLGWFLRSMAKRVIKKQLEKVLGL